MTTTTDSSVSHAPKLSPGDRRQLCRDLATREQTPAAIARKYGITRQSVRVFAKRHATEIDAIAARLDDDFAGLWIADKGQRISAAQDDYELSLAGEYAGHYEHIRTRTQIRSAVAEELGQLPPRATVTVVPVTHVVVDVDLEALT